MAFRNEEIVTYKTILICDDCGDEILLHEGKSLLNFDNRMNKTLQRQFTFKNYGDGKFKNYCSGCKNKY